MMTSTPTYQENAREFLKTAPQFTLGILPTETRHPNTLRLSSLVNSDLPRALAILKAIDLDMLAVLKHKLDDVWGMAAAIKATLDHNGRIFLCGCGSTGRLALTLETLWRELHQNSDLHDRVVSFMAGGDIALIKAVEEFEDHPEYGARQLMELGFSPDDLLISTTEGGETPFVIGATEQAAAIAKRAPYFLYCNPDDILIQVAERSQRIIEHPHIRTLNLTVGPMAISGSTRMQASSILMLAVGLALHHYHESLPQLTEEFDTLYRFYEHLDIAALHDFIEAESRMYQQNGYLFYNADQDFAISILTDTTERSPTFSLHPFENMQDRNDDFCPSLCYLALPQANTAQEAWRLLLGREPRALDWAGLEGQVDLQRLYGHDFSRNILRYRREYLPDHTHAEFRIEHVESTLRFQLNDCSFNCSTQGLSRLSAHLVLKMLLNTHSTLVMGRLGRYEGNLMSYVKPSNNKLIDRTIRYVRLLLEQHGIDTSYDDAAYACFQVKENLKPDEPIVLHIVQHFLDQQKLP